MHENKPFSSLLGMISIVIVSFILIFVVAILLSTGPTLEMTLYIVAGLASLLVGWFRWSGRRFGNHKFQEAQVFEKDGDYRQACLYYAVAILNGAKDSNVCREKVGELWKAYGPFKYSDEVKEAADSNDEHAQCNQAGYATTMSIIEAIVTNKPSNPPKV